MILSEKIDLFIKEKGMSQKELAAEIGLNYVVMNRNILANKLTIDFILAMVKTYPEVDLNWLIKEDFMPYLHASEPSAKYETASPEEIIDQVHKLLDKLKEDLANK
jgi:transcriptional regulator with XRE-family HTH domain